MTHSSRPNMLRLLAFTVLALVLAATSGAQERPPVAEQMAKTYGLDAFGKIENIRYTFNAEFSGVQVARTWEWEPKTGQVTYEGKDKDGTPVQVTYQRSQLSSQSDTVKHAIDPAFINDQYWLLFPLHTAWDSSATVTAEGVHKLPLGQSAAERVVVQYASEGGYSPGDTWGLYVGADHRVEAFIYHRGRTNKAQRRDRDVGGLQAGWASPYLTRSPGHGGRQAATSFPFGCVRQGDGIRQLDERAIEKGGVFGPLMSFLRISLPVTTTSATGVLDCRVAAQDDALSPYPSGTGKGAHTDAGNVYGPSTNTIACKG